MAICVLCGCEVNLLSQKVIHLCSTQQLLCPACDRTYQRADKGERERLQKQILSSPHLRNREAVQEFLAATQAATQRRTQEQIEAQQRADFLRQHMPQKLHCCDSPMEYLGQGSYTQYPLGFFAAAAPRLISIFECPVCGQVKFFNPDFIPSALREKEDEHG